MKFLKELFKELSENCISILLGCFLVLVFLGSGFHICYQLLYRNPAGIWGYLIGAALAAVMALLIGFPVIAVCSLIRDNLKEKRNGKNADGCDSMPLDDVEKPAAAVPDRQPDRDRPLSADEIASFSVSGAAEIPSGERMKPEDSDSASSGEGSYSHGSSCSLFCNLVVLFIILIVAGLFVSAGSASEAKKLFDAGMTAYAEKDYPAASKAFIAAAKKGNAGAQYRLGVCYYKGRGVAKDWKAAFHWFYEAAKQDDPDALYRLGLCYEQAVGTDRDMERAFFCWARAAKLGHADAQCKVGATLIPLGEYDEAIERLRKPAEQGSPYAMRLLAFAYERKGRDDAADYWCREAVGAFRKAAEEEGDPSAMHNLAVLYRDGKGVAKDPAEAEKWFERAAEAYRKAAEEGDPDAQAFLDAHGK